MTPDARDPLAPLSRRPRVWVLGDVMLDRYLRGAVERVSPEAPVPVLRLQDTEQRAGGAANVALNLATLGARVALGGVVGADEAGQALRRLLAEEAVGQEALRTLPEARTALKVRALAGGQQLLRIDDEIATPPLPRAQVQALLAALRAELPQPELVVLSDYGKGLWTPLLWEELRRAAGDAPIFVDPKGRDFGRYRGAALITPNEREAALAAAQEIHDEPSLLRAAEGLARELPGTAVLITRGPRGMTLRLPEGRTLHAAAQARRVFDVTGAGDTALAALALGRAQGLPWAETLELANTAAGLAVGKVGTALVHRSELLGALARRPGGDAGAGKRLTFADLADLRRSTARLGQRLVFTNGCFDLLHVGHLQLLTAARARGDVLLVALNSDASVRRLKGPARPLCPEDERAQLLCGLQAVDFVTIFDEDTPLRLIDRCRPDVLVKGGDYDAEAVVGAREVRGWGGEVVIVPLVPGRSTTRMAARLGAREVAPAY